MRKVQKQQAEDLVKLLEQAHEQIRRVLEKKNIRAAMSLLADCQDGAIALGTHIETIEGDGIATIPLLEEYCELVYQIYQGLESRGDADGSVTDREDFLRPEKVYKRLRRIHGKIAGSIQTDIKVRQEVVFLPYKASMWDSLESVWKAADEDPDCDAYVIPIPYYDRDPEGGIREEHYEGEKYPENVPVTWYEEYDFEGHRPDIIFIHNPYDEYNRVTTVHPFFYSRNIKRFTDCLVYIPYYETGGMQAESLEMLPAYFASDFIIAQSEEHRRQFDNQFLKKILVLGSPKFDKIINFRINDGDISQEWKRKLHKEVFFYNTSISGLLKDSYLAIEKMKYVFEIFSRENVTLIWRPHPLLESTIKSMRPEILDQYEEAVKYFGTLKYGILDKTPDASIAIKLSNAYIGEETSSMVHLFGILGKPILISNLAINQDFEKETGNSQFFCIVEEGDVLWAPIGDRNGLIRYEKSSEKTEKYLIPNEKADGHRLYNAIVSYGEVLYLIPYNAAEIAVFNKVTRKFIKIPFDNPSPGNFTKAYIYNKKVYMIPARYPAIIQLDCETNDVAYINMAWTKKLLHDPKEAFSFNGSMMIGSVILIALTFDDLILQIDLSNMDMSIVEFNGRCGKKAKGFWCMAGNSKHIILGSNSGRRLFYWNRDTNDCRILEPYPKDWTGDEKCFFEMIYLNGDVYVFPKTGNQILKINLESLKIESMEGTTEEFANMNSRKNDYYSWASNTLFAKRSGDHILFQSAFDYKIYEIYGEKEIRAFQIDLSDVTAQEDMKGNFYRRGKNLPWAMRETKINSIPYFIKYVQSGVHDQSVQIREYCVVAENIDGTAGEKIYRRVSRHDAGRYENRKRS